MPWAECTKDKYTDAYNYIDAVCSAEKHETIWRSRNGNPVAKSSHGYARPIQGEERFFVWQGGGGLAQ